MSGSLTGLSIGRRKWQKLENVTVAVHLGVKMADTLSFTAKVDMVDF